MDSEHSKLQATNSLAHCIRGQVCKILCAILSCKQVEHQQNPVTCHVNLIFCNLRRLRLVVGL